MTIEIKGKWEKGYALEYHTIGSKYLGEDEFGHKKFETTRTELGKLVYKLKYKADFSVVSQIINYIIKSITISEIDYIIPVLPSKSRKEQPVFVIAEELSKRTGIKFLKNIHYENVRVFCSGNRCRNNIGNWETVNIPVPENIKGLKFYMAKDIEMAKKANFGFMIWDGKSAGTLNNVIQLIKQNKKVVIYFTPENTFINIANIEDIMSLINKCKKEELKKIDQKIKLKNLLNEFNQLNLLTKKTF